MKVRVSQLSKFTRTELDAAFKIARRVVKHPGIHILLAPAQKLFGRILVIVPKAFGSAPERNKIRRQIKAIYYEEKLFERQKDCIVLIKPNETHLSFQELKTLLLQAFEQHD